MMAASAMSDSARGWISTAVAIVLVAVIARQFRRPRWVLGRAFAEIMNRSHGPLTQWALGHIEMARDATILDVGCGGGATIGRLASLAPNGKVFGVDYSSTSVATARRTNAARIAAGTVDVRLASVSSLPFEANAFDVVTAVETHYYWPNLRDDLREILRVLEPGGTLLIVAEAYAGRWSDWLFKPVLALLGGVLLSKSQTCDALTAAGFSDVSAFEERSKGWLCVRGIKAAAAPGETRAAAGQASSLGGSGDALTTLPATPRAL